jgi:hypothetical protein
MLSAWATSARVRRSRSADTSPPGSAETSPGFRQMPVSQAIGSRPLISAWRSVPSGDVTRTTEAPRSRSASFSARTRIARKSAVIAPSFHADARYGALNTPRAPARCAAAFAAVW